MLHLDLYFNLLQKKSLQINNNNFIILQNNSLVWIITIYSSFYNYYFKFFNKTTYSISYYYLNNNFLTANLFDTYNFYFYFFSYKLKDIKYTKYLLSKFIYFWTKITFRGKGFRIRKFLKSKKITFNFGRSHWTKIAFNQKYFKVIKIRRQNYLVFTFLKYNFYALMYCIRKIKQINRYTKRGLRLRRQLIKKRFGKISQMVSSLQF